MVMALHKAGIRKYAPKPAREDAPSRPGINLNNVFALASGALPLTLECTVSYDRPDKPQANMRPTRTYSFDELLEVTYVTIKAFLEAGLEKPFVVRGAETVYKD